MKTNAYVCYSSVKVGRMSKRTQFVYTFTSILMPPIEQHNNHWSTSPLSGL